jgi:Zn-dependent protease
MRRCTRCSQPLEPEALVCERCHTLVHSEELERLAAQAKTLETRGEFQHARDLWLAALRLLPPTSKQAGWISQHARALGNASVAGSPAADRQWSQAIAPAGPITVPAARSTPRRTARLQLTSILSFLAFVAIYSAASGMKFGIGFAALILIHEMGHFVDIKRRGLPADMPVFLPGLGAYVRWQALGVPLETRAAVSLAGPLAGFFAALACAVLWWQTGNPLWAALARSGAILNLLNLIPVWVLDGGQAALALNKAERIALLIAGVALWLLLGQRLFLLVALGAGYRAFFARDLPPRPSRSTTIYFVAVLAALGVIVWLMPGQGLGAN